MTLPESAPQAPEPMITFRGVTKSFTGSPAPAVENLTMDISRGDRKSVV